MHTFRVFNFYASHLYENENNFIATYGATDRHQKLSEHQSSLRVLALILCYATLDH